MPEPTKEDLIKEIDYQIGRFKQLTGLKEPVSLPLPRKVLMGYGFIQGLEYAKNLLQNNNMVTTWEELDWDKV